MIDFDAAEILSLELLFEGIQIFLCDFHREQAWTRWVNKKDNGVYHIADDVKSRLRRIAVSNNFSECEQAILDLRSWDFFKSSPKLKLYFENTWYPEIQRWCLAYRPDDLLKCNTNNGTERLNETLKYDTLDNYKNSTLTESVKSQVQFFLPNLYEKYVSLNIQYTSGHKGYCLSIPRYMVNRPGPLVEDMMRKMNNVTPFMVESVYPVTPLVSLVFMVESINDQDNTRNMYTVRFGDEKHICSCECQSFRRDRLLCKHFFAVFKSKLPYSFHDLSPLYLNHPYTSIDVDVVGGANIFENTIVEVESELEESVLPTQSEQPSSTSMLHASLPLRRKNRSTSTSHECFARLKVINDKLYNNPEARDRINIELGGILEMLNEFELFAHGDGELGVRDKAAAVVPEPDDVSNVVSTLPVRRYPNDLCIYQELPKHKGKVKHSHSGRYGEIAEVMRKQLRTKVPVKTTVTTQAPSVLIDGTGDICDSFVFNDRDFEHEEYLMQLDVMECVDDMLDLVVNCANAPTDHSSDDDFEF